MERRRSSTFLVTTRRPSVTVNKNSLGNVRVYKEVIEEWVEEEYDDTFGEEEDEFGQLSRSNRVSSNNSRPVSVAINSNTSATFTGLSEVKEENEEAAANGNSAETTSPPEQTGAGAEPETNTQTAAATSRDSNIVSVRRVSIMAMDEPERRSLNNQNANGPSTFPRSSVSSIKSNKTHHDLTAQQHAEIREVFDLFDTDGSASIDMSELRIVMRSLGFNPSKEEVMQLASEFVPENDEDASLSFDEFLFLMAAKIVIINNIF